jgi:hypothetical protein
MKPLDIFVILILLVIGNKMKTLFVLILIGLAFFYHKELGDFITGNATQVVKEAKETVPPIAKEADGWITRWLRDNTPKK